MIGTDDIADGFLELVVGEYGIAPLDGAIGDFTVSDEDDIPESLILALFGDNMRLCSSSSILDLDGSFESLSVCGVESGVPEVKGVSVRAVHGEDVADGAPVVLHASDRAGDVDEHLVLF